MELFSGMSYLGSSVTLNVRLNIVNGMVAHAMALGTDNAE